MIWVFLPAYNEEVALERLVPKFDAELSRGAELYKIVVLDDGSTDGTAEAARRLGMVYPLTLLRHEKNQGLGRTMIDGLEHCAREAAPGDAVVTLDCDDTHEPKYVHAALAKLREGADVAILSRYAPGGGEKGLSPVRSVLSRGAGLFLKVFFPIPGVQEYSCGYRVFRASILKRAFDTFGENFVRLPHKGFVVTPEILIKMRLLDARIVEVPFTLDYGKKPGKSKNRPLKTISGYFSLVRLYFGRTSAR